MSPLSLKSRQVAGVLKVTSTGSVYNVVLTIQGYFSSVTLVLTDFGWTDTLRSRGVWRVTNGPRCLLHRILTYKIGPLSQVRAKKRSKAGLQCGSLLVKQMDGYSTGCAGSGFDCCGYSGHL